MCQALCQVQGHSRHKGPGPSVKKAHSMAFPPELIVAELSTTNDVCAPSSSVKMETPCERDSVPLTPLHHIPAISTREDHGLLERLRILRSGEPGLEPSSPLAL